MYTLWISLFSSLCVGFYMKQLKIDSTKNLALFIAFGYLAAAILSWLFFDVSIHNLNFSTTNYIIIALLGIGLPSMFFILYKALKVSGIMRTDIFQRLSLIIPVVLSFKLFNEQATAPKIVAIILSFLSIILLLYKKSKGSGKFSLVYLLTIFFGYGIVDTLFKLIATDKRINYTTTLFIVFLCCLVVAFIYFLCSKGKVAYKYTYLGLLLGVLNFMNIFFYLKAHKIFADSPTLVFITMNLGVIIGGTLIGRFYFKEALRKHTLYGIVLAVLSISLLALVQLHIL